MQRVLACLVGLVATAAIVSTYRVFNNMFDEPAHIAAGMEWLSRGTYTLEPQHPPLSRVASAVLPWLAGARSTGETHMYTEGRRVLGRGEQYERMLTLARLGQLPFFALLLVVTWYWARRIADEPTAAVAVAAAAANPNLLAHAGVAGTDIGPAALMPAALLAWVLFLESPTRRRSALLGAAVALCALTKFSALAFWLPAALLTALIAAWKERERFRGRLLARSFGGPLLLAAGVAALVTWAGYRFSFGRVEGGNLVLPAPELWAGVSHFLGHGARGHPAYLFGEVSDRGWWYYDLVVLALKTPIPLMILGVAGGWLAVRRFGSVLALAPVAGIVAVVAVASATPVDLGVRLVLPVYPLLAVLAALAFMWAWRRPPRGRVSHRFALGAAAFWMVAEPGLTHPDHIAYFNQLAGPRPERILVDSNLDWGQDLYRLRDASRALGMDSLRVHYFGTAEFAAVGLERARRLRPHERTTGWVAASETFYAGVWSDTALHWLRRHEPVGWVGRSIRLYYIK